MELRNRTNGIVVTESQFRAEHPDTSFPRVLTVEILDSFGYDPVLEGPQATTVPPYQYSQRDGVVEVDGKWFTHYIAGPVFTDPDDEAAYRARMDAEQAERIRTERNRRLEECDWTQLSDAPADSAEWGVYRQELRDVPSHAGFPWDVAWPKAPTA